MTEFRFTRVWPVVVFVLALLFALQEPQSTRNWPILLAWAFWVAHIGLGLLLAIIATATLGPRLPPRLQQTWMRLALGGLVGSLLFTPIALGLELIFDNGPPAPPDDWLDTWEQAGGWRMVVAEWMSLAPPYLVSWALLNVVPLANRSIDSGDAVARRLARTETAGVSAVIDAALAAEPLAPPLASAGAADPMILEVAATPSILNRIPPAIGRELVMVQADLHYLQVRTTRGRATVLGSMAEVATELADKGVRVHRSFWVARAHVRSIKKTTSGWICEMHDGTRVPISRRNVAEVRAQFGSDFVQG